MRQQDTGENRQGLSRFLNAAQINSNFYATARSAPAGY
jgi:hypothetical protein